MSEQLAAPEASRFYKGCHILARFITTMAWDLKTYGIHHIPKRGGVLLVSNHQSYLDPVLVGVHLRRPLGYIARADLFEHKYLNWLIRSLNAFPVRRGEGDIGAMKEGIRRLKEGNILTMFPEGTRTNTGEIGPIQPGIALLIRKAEVPVVPAVIEGSLAAWPRGQKAPGTGRVRVMYGEPMKVEGMKGAAIVELIDKTLRRLQEELRKKS